MTTNAIKLAAQKQWNADPCDEHRSEGEPGTRPYFDRLLAARHEHAPWIAEVLDYARTGGLRVLDIGCGQGIDVALYAQAGARVTGIDLTQRHLELARSHLAALGLEARIAWGDAERLPFGAGEFDRVSSNGVLHHTPDISRAFSEIERVLRPGGQARIIVYNRNSLHYWVQQVLRHGVMSGMLLSERSMAGVLSRTVEYSQSGGRPLVRVYSPQHVRRLMRRSGFVNVRTEVRHFRVEDTFLSRWLAVRHGRLARPQLLDRIGRLAGWYVVGYGLANHRG